MSKGGRFHGEGLSAEILRPRAIICPAGLFRLLARAAGRRICIHARYIAFVDYLTNVFPSLFTSYLTVCARAKHRRINYTRASSVPPRAKLTRRRRKKKEVREVGEGRKGEKRKRGEEGDIKVAPRLLCHRMERSILTKSIHEP